ncbi:ABC transporter A family member 10 [Acorus gramineus]|uniref:ABC transporter A family member 10 n=1 Tax=Acorus gramineus TaxID=55184 RepID=A0AAV9AMQ3_ACOGR|nr:ABC transporter A family member 10 [Acorus gramineus]
MADSRGAAGFWTQTHALLRKNLSLQKRNMRTNIGLVIFPAVLCLMLYGIQRMVDSVFTATSTDTSNPTRWPALVQVPETGDRVVRGKSTCVDEDSCPVMVFLTGGNQSLAQSELIFVA